MDFTQIILILLSITILLIFGYVIYQCYTRRRNLKEAKLLNAQVFSEKSLKPFIIIKKVPLVTSGKDAEANVQFKIMKEKMDTFLMRNKFYEIETL